MPTEYLEVKGGGRTLVVTQKAWTAIYAAKGFSIVRRNVAAPRPPERTEDDVAEGDEDEFTPPISAMLRKSQKDIVTWIKAGETPFEINRRALAIFQREQEGRARTGVLNAVSALAGAYSADEDDDEDNTNPD